MVLVEFGEAVVHVDGRTKLIGNLESKDTVVCGNSIGLVEAVRNLYCFDAPLVYTAAVVVLEVSMYQVVGYIGEISRRKG